MTDQEIIRLYNERCERAMKKGRESGSDVEKRQISDQCRRFEQRIYLFQHHGAPFVRDWNRRFRGDHRPCQIG